MDEKTIEVINDQIHLDLDAIQAYEDAIRGCDSAEIKAQLAMFRADHERHVTDLSDMVRVLGGEPAKSTDVKGFFIHGFTKMTSLGDRSALMAMRGNEELTNRSYKAALENELPEDVRILFMRNYGDEQRHLAWIKGALSSRSWDRDEPTAAPPAP